MRKIYIALAVVLILGVSFLFITQILFRGDYYRQIERKFFYKNCPAYVYITGEYIGTAPEVAAIESEVRSLGFEKIGVKQLENKKIQMIIAGVDDTQMAAVSERVGSALSKLGEFQVEEMATGSNSVYKARSCPLD